jgi:hypothetical protein
MEIVMGNRKKKKRIILKSKLKSGGSWLNALNPKRERSFKTASAGIRA